MYKLFTSPIGQEFILIVETNTYIPIDQENNDYKEYLKWVAEGNTPEPADQGE
jgi:hypothetical protein